MLKVPSYECRVAGVTSKTLFILFFVSLWFILSGCNLQMQVATPTVAPSETPLTPLEASPLPILTPLAQTTSQPTLAAPPLPVFVTPTALPLNPAGAGTVLPTISALEVDQRYELQARPGKTVGVNYTITLIRGSVTLTLQGAEGVLWQQTFTATETGRAEVTVQQGGTYEILAQVENFDGNYALGWD